MPRGSLPRKTPARTRAAAVPFALGDATRPLTHDHSPPASPPPQVQEAIRGGHSKRALQGGSAAPKAMAPQDDVAASGVEIPFKSHNIDPKDIQGGTKAAERKAKAKEARHLSLIHI